jgi:DNA-binding NarL/FixJ family response regulator
MQSPEIDSTLDPLVESESNGAPSEHWQTGGAAMDSDTFPISDHSTAPPNVTPPRGALERLTHREREVVLRALRGGANKEIAYDLGLAHSTVRVFMARAAEKLGASSRRDLLEKVAEILNAETV